MLNSNCIIPFNLFISLLHKPMHTVFDTGLRAVLKNPVVQYYQL